MTGLGGWLASGGWQPGTPVATPSLDPTNNPNPADLISGVGPAIKTALVGSAGASLLVAAGVLALIKGFGVLIGMLKARREPKQLTLF